MSSTTPSVPVDSATLNVPESEPTSKLSSTVEPGSLGGVIISAPVSVAAPVPKLKL